jgi:hypothetical protein
MSVAGLSMADACRNSWHSRHDVAVSPNVEIEQRQSAAALLSFAASLPFYHEHLCL